MMWNNITAMTVEQFTCLRPYNLSSPSPAAQPSFTLGWHMAKLHEWMEITVKGQLLLCFAMFFSEMIILGILLVRTRNSEWLMWENDTLRNYTSNTILQCSFGFRSQQYLQENNTCGNEGQRFHCITNSISFLSFLLAMARIVSSNPLNYHCHMFNMRGQVIRMVCTDSPRSHCFHIKRKHVLCN